MSKLKRFETGFVGSATGNPATLDHAFEKNLISLDLTGEIVRTIPINGTAYDVPSNISLYTSVQDTDGNVYTPSGYVYPAKQGSTFGLYHFDTGVFQTEV